MDLQNIFQLSKVNGALYYGDALPQQNWKWPKNTWLQQRLRELRTEEGQVEAASGKRHAGIAVRRRSLEENAEKNRRTRMQGHFAAR